MCILYDFWHPIFIGIPSKTVRRKTLTGYLQGSPSLKGNHRPKCRRIAESIYNVTSGDLELEIGVGLTGTWKSLRTLKSHSQLLLSTETAQTACDGVLFFTLEQREWEAVLHHTQGLVPSRHRHCADHSQPEHLRDVFGTNVHTDYFHNKIQGWFTNRFIFTKSSVNLSQENHQGVKHFAMWLCPEWRTILPHLLPSSLHLCLLDSSLSICYFLPHFFFFCI